MLPSFPPVSPRLSAALQAALVTVLWTSSWVLIKIGLIDIPPLLFAGLRYTLGAAILAAVYWRSAHKVDARGISAGAWGLLAAYGIVFFAIGQGSQFVSLKYLPAVTTNLILANIPIAVALLSIPFLKEPPGVIQWLGIAVSLGGVLLYFLPVIVSPSQAPGIIAAWVSVLSNALASILGRSLNRGGKYPALWITFVSMAVGAPIMLGVGLLLDPFPAISLKNWLAIGWLAAVNTAFAFTLWNHTLKTLTAVESSVINSLMIIEIPLLAVVFLAERMTCKEAAGLLLVAAGILVVQISAARKKEKSALPSSVMDA